MVARRTMIPLLSAIADGLTSGGFSRLTSLARDALVPQPIAVAPECAATANPAYGRCGPATLAASRSYSLASGCHQPRHLSMKPRQILLPGFAFRGELRQRLVFGLFPDDEGN